MQPRAVTTTDFNFPGQTGVYHGKVRDVYTIEDNLLVMVATDRISAFDVVLPRGIPYKGQVLNQIADYFLNNTADIVPNWLMSTPDPNVSIGKKAEPFAIEMIIRGSLLGSSWREYQNGVREICGAKMPEGMQQYDMFPEPLVTPTTKADEGHDENITPEEIVARGLATQEEWDQLCDYTSRLFARGQQMARERGLALVDTKYEFGKIDGQIVLIDEIHTPDSSRYFYADSYDNYLRDRTQPEPKQLSKEFVREWLLANNFDGKNGNPVPEMTDEFVDSVSERYIELYEEITGQKFVKAEAEDIINRIEANVTAALGSLR